MIAHGTFLYKPWTRSHWVNHVGMPMSHTARIQEKKMRLPTRHTASQETAFSSVHIHWEDIGPTLVKRAVVMQDTRYSANPNTILENMDETHAQNLSPVDFRESCTYFLQETAEGSQHLTHVLSPCLISKTLFCRITLIIRKSCFRYSILLYNAKPSREMILTWQP